MENISILKANSKEEIEVVRELFIEYQNFLQVDLCFQSFNEELAKLPYKYAEPEGTILLAKVDEKFAGVVALWKLEEGVCEMKRLFVKDKFKGLGIGRKLAERLLEEAKSKGYKIMKLDTLKRLKAANELYPKLGFIETNSYNYNPENDVAYFEKTL
jgi:putative acetyltransferase